MPDYEVRLSALPEVEPWPRVLFRCPVCPTVIELPEAYFLTRTLRNCPSCGHAFPLDLHHVIKSMLSAERESHDARRYGGWVWQRLLRGPEGERP